MVVGIQRQDILQHPRNQLVKYARMNPYRHFYLYLSETYQLSEYSMDFHEVRSSMHGAYPANGLQKTVPKKCNVQNRTHVFDLI